MPGSREGWLGTARTAGEDGSLNKMAGDESALRGAASLSSGTFHRKENRAVPARKRGTARMAAHRRSLFRRPLPLCGSAFMEEPSA